MYENFKKIVVDKYAKQENYFRHLCIDKSYWYKKLRGIVKWSPYEIEMTKKELNYDLEKRND